MLPATGEQSCTTIMFMEWAFYDFIANDATRLAFEDSGNGWRESSSPLGQVKRDGAVNADFRPHNDVIIQHPVGTYARNVTTQKSAASSLPIRMLFFQHCIRNGRYGPFLYVTFY